MKIWLGTGRVKGKVAIFIDRPVVWCETGHHWHKDSLLSERKEAEKEFRVLPVHGSQDLIEFNLVGNGRVGQNLSRRRYCNEEESHLAW